MRIPDAAKGLVRGFKSAYHKIADHRKSHEHSELPLFNAGISDWILDLAALALVALIVGQAIKWAYLTLFPR